MEPHGGQPTMTAGAALGTGDGVMIMVHGRNAGPRNILDLVPVLDRPAFTYIAPAAAGGTWYPYSFMAEKATNEPGLSSALQTLGELVASIVARGVSTRRIMLLGFSQGACLSAEFAARTATRYGGIVIFSGGLIGPPGTTWPYPGAFGGTPVFLGCSDVDAHIPKGRVDESAAVFVRMGAVVTERIYAGMGHTVNEEEIEAARGIMDAVASLS